jgi:hypothetical protein
MEKGRNAAPRLKKDVLDQLVEGGEIARWCKLKAESFRGPADLQNDLPSKDK